MIRRAITTGTTASLGLARLPLKVAGPLLPAKVRGFVELQADQAQATVESLVGSVLHVDDLSERGRLRQAAVDQRASSLRLWTQAGDQRRLADLDLARKRSEAAKQREAAETQYVDAEAAVEEARKAGLREAENVKQKRKAAVKDAAAKQKAKAADEANQRRLEVLKAEEQALDVADAAATTADEADRLAAKAAVAKARRKTG